jgi:hypothetical protein
MDRDRRAMMTVRTSGITLSSCDRAQLDSIYEDPDT